MAKVFMVTDLGRNAFQDPGLSFVEQEIISLVEADGPLTAEQITFGLQVESNINIINFRVQKTLDDLEDNGLVKSFRKAIPLLNRLRRDDEAMGGTTGFQDTSKRVIVGRFTREERLEDRDLSGFITFDQPDVKFRTDKMSPN